MALTERARNRVTFSGINFKRVALRIRRLPLLPMAVFLLLIVSALFAPWIAPHSPIAGDYKQHGLEPPFWQRGGSREFILGTDSLGRDVLSRIIFGARVSLIVGGMAVAFAGTIGSTLGLLSGYFGGKVDAVIMRIVDIMLSMPPMLVAIAIVGVLGPSLRNVIMVIAVMTWASYARLIRGEVLSVRRKDFVALAIVGGCHPARILLRHIFPNIVNTLIVLATLQLGTTIIWEASLSFLGLGVPPPAASWGLMLADGRVYITSAWWLATFPGLAIMLTCLGANLLGDWLRDTLDPRRRQL